MTFDLQSHSTWSDGALPPGEVVARAAAAGIELLALTDHDTVDGVDEALDAAREAGISLVPASELSAVDGEHADLHVLGYGIDHHAPVLLDALAGYRADRERRALAMAARLEELGFVLDRSGIAARAAAGRPIGRPHLATAAFGHSANAARLRDEGLDDATALLRAYLLDSAPAFVRRSTPSTDEAISLIHAAGGVAVWAHPFWDVEDPAEVTAMLERLAAAGLDGVEAFYVTHDEAQTRLLDEVAERLGLLTTGSADFHGPEHRLFSRFGAFETYGLEPRLGPIA